MAILVGPSLASGALAPADALVPPLQDPAAIDGALDVSFEPNLGQWSEDVRFVGRARGLTAYFAAQEILIVPSGASPRSDAPPLVPQDAVRLLPVGSSPGVDLVPEETTGARANYLRGSDPARWVVDVPVHRQVRYQGLYPGVDLLFHGTTDGRLKYDLEIAPGADVGAIAFEVTGGTLVVDPSGALVVSTASGALVQDAPVSHELVDGVARPVSSAYRLLAPARFGFDVGRLHASAPVVVDPALSYASYVGGSGTDDVRGVATDAAGNTYLVGTTSSTDFPDRNGMRGTLAGSSDLFVAKLDAAGALVYATYLGGTGAGEEAAAGIAVDASGNAYVTGHTTSFDYPRVNPLQPAQTGTFYAIVSKLNAQGNGLVYSSYVGGSGGGSFGRAIAVDASGQAYVTGSTHASNFPTSNAHQATHGSGGAGSPDAFVFKVSAAGSAFVYSTFLGGNQHDLGNGVAVDGAGNAYVAGMTLSTNFPLASPLQPTPGGADEAFVAKLSSSGSLLFSTYLGGSDIDLANAIEVDAGGNAYVAGETYSANFPTSSPYQATMQGTVDAFMLKLSASNALVYSTYLGGAADDFAFGLDVDDAGFAYVAGYTYSPNFPTKNAVQPVHRGAIDAFVSVVNGTGAALLMSTFYGGVLTDMAFDVAVDAFDDVVLVGSTLSQDLLTSGTVQSSYGGGLGDGFVAKIQLEAFVDALPDTDDDGLRDADERNVRATDPLDPDTDDDGLTDGQEVVAYRTPPTVADADGDGWSDGREVLAEGTDPRVADSDGDGTPDASDPTPRRENAPPAYTSAGDAFLALDEEGYIDVYFLEASDQEADLLEVMVSGNLTARTPSGPVAWPLYFRMEAKRGDEGLWRARFPIPPGVEEVTSESLRLMAIDRSGNAWAYTGDFSIGIRGPGWSDALEAASPATGWSHLINHTSTGAAQSQDAQSQEAQFQGVHAFRLRSQPERLQVALGPIGSLVVAEGAFEPVDPTQDAAFAIIYVPPPEVIYAGFAQAWNGVVDPVLDSGLVVLQEAGYQTGSVLLGSDSPIAGGRMAGEFVSGFFVWGDFRDCVIRPYVVPTDNAAEAAIVGLSCVGLGADLAQASPGAPAAVSANAAIGLAKGAVKAVKRVEPRFATHIVDMAHACARDVTLCVRLADVANHVIANPAAAKSLVHAADVLGAETFLRVAAKSPGMLAKVERIAGDVALHHGDAVARTTLTRMHQASKLGSADETFEKLTDLHKVYADHPEAGGRVAADVLVGTTKFQHVDGADEWVKAAQRQANPSDKDGWRGYAYEAPQLARLADAGQLLRVQDRITGFIFNGRAGSAQVDAFVSGAGGLKRLTELKAGSVREDSLPQLKRQLAGVNARAVDLGLERVVEWRIGGTVSQGFKDGLDSYASAYNVQVRLLDANGMAITRFVP